MKKMSEITTKYIGLPFSECGCIDFVYRFLRDCGADIPKSFESVSVDTYMELVHKNKKLAEATMVRAFKTIGTKIPVNNSKTGDLLIIMQPNKTMYPAIYIGGGDAMASFIRIGVSVFGLSEKDKPIMARRVL